MKVIVTGGNSGVGAATATTLAADGHSVVIACRTVAKAERVAAAMSGDVTIAHLDLADLASVRKFADSVDGVDVLINNAGVLGLPLTRTADGFEAHMGTNYLGHFALTCLLGDRIQDRVISVVSSAYAMSRLHLDDLNWDNRPYSKWSAYGESKLAVMLFNHELTSRGMRTYHDRSGCDGHRHHAGTPPGWCRGFATTPFAGFRLTARPPAHGRPFRRSPPICPAGLISRRGSINGAGRKSPSRAARRATPRWPAVSGTSLSS